MFLSSDHVALVKQGENALGSIRLSVGHVSYCCTITSPMCNLLGILTRRARRGRGRQRSGIFIFHENTLICLLPLISWHDMPYNDYMAPYYTQFGRLAKN